ncbi:S1C family serine protease [Luteolibacter arcticus]|uniref:S1C family serine protease n=1 Tax=Luteolibacter arcticus TaxID=1581411 RepID=A0ABT3GPY8_9BACT|nr:S1C family serine protease [Luteolibacter arcticus]MCW1925585.1 S1C family serine protease [Luteolibacter arcticus]
MTDYSSGLLLGVFTGLLLFSTQAEAARPYINDKKAPEGRHDLEVIQKHLTEALPATRKATVCIDLGEGSGSGVVVTADGLILTAAHVSGGVGKEFTVIFEDGKKAKAESLGLVSTSDCAMARITEPGTWPHVEIDREDSAKLGDWVYSLGHSGGFDKERGVNVRLGRLVQVRDDTVQSDCSLIGGDSGGPLFDLNGKLIGIHSRVGQRTQENMHVPIREFLKNWDALQKSEFVGEGPFAKKPEKGKGFLGIGTAVRPEGGLSVDKVGRESPAEKAGLKAGDILLKMDGVDLKSKEQFQDLLKEKAPDDRVALELLRDGKPETLTLRLGER